MIDDTVSKAQYMNILIGTIKDDLSKIGKWVQWWFVMLMMIIWGVIWRIVYNKIVLNLLDGSESEV